MRKSTKVYSLNKDVLNTNSNLFYCLLCYIQTSLTRIANWSAKSKCNALMLQRFSWARNLPPYFLLVGYANPLSQSSVSMFQTLWRAIWVSNLNSALPESIHNNLRVAFYYQLWLTPLNCDAESCHQSKALVLIWQDAYRVSINVLALQSLKTSMHPARPGLPWVTS